jgi:hypothetical protein
MTNSKNQDECSHIRNGESNYKVSRRILIPAAGFGSRVGHPMAKEMLVRPDGVRFIDHALLLASLCQATPHVISRAEKKNLNQHLKSLGVSIQLVEPTQEWPESLLKSKEYWSDYNLVILPDTDFGPVEILSEMFVTLENKSDLVAARFSVEDFRTWGVMGYDRRDPQLWWGCEKPLSSLGREWDLQAWGVFGFRKEFGEKILKTLLESTLSHEWKTLCLNYHFFQLDYFRDLTR